MDRTLPAVWAAKGASLASRTLGRGGGTALPGLVAERVEPRVVARLARTLGRGAAIVTGTNGKTTTARMTAEILRAAGMPVLHNRSGSNLMRGLAATVTSAAGVDGRIPDVRRTAGVFEVDEATLPPAAHAIRPRAVAFTNLFRDQLDRYGEVDSIAALWRETVSALPPASTVILNVDDPSVAALRRDTRTRLLTLGIEDMGATGGVEEHPADARWCGVCGTEFAYTARFFWHVGHWRCPGCGDARPTPDVAAERVRLDEDSADVTMRTPAGPLTLTLPLGGLYNVYNALSATAAALTMGAPLSAVRTGLEGFTAAFGRQEALAIDGRDVRVMLCKNPAGVNQVLRTLLAAPGPLYLLVALSDGIADGRDVSWIWDVDYELLRGRAAGITVSGTRAADMALRLKYAGLADLQVEADQARAVDAALTATPPGARLHVLPTYTAMLTTREHLARRAGGRSFWKQ